MDDVDTQIGAIIRGRRNHLGLTQEDLGNALRDKLSHQQIQKYEKGENSISCARLVLIAEALEVTASHFFDSIKLRDAHHLSESPTPPYEFESNKQLQNLIRAFKELPNETMRKAVVDFIKIVSSNTKPNDKK